jgi:cyanuric acid amidohydrolase
MSVTALFRVMTAEPADTSGLLDAVKEGLDPGRAVAVIGKTEGNGCVNDFTRGMAAAAWQSAFAPSVVAVMSGGTEGVLSPHVTIVAEEDDDPRFPANALTVATGRSRLISTAMLGRRPQADAVAEAVREICASAGIGAADVHLALVKCPLLTGRAIEAAGDVAPVTTDTYASMAFSRAASALGVAAALGEISDDELEAGLAGDRTVCSAVASASAGVEVDRCEIVILGHRHDAHGRLRASHTVMADAVDARPVGLLLDGIRRSGGRVVQVFAKAEADPSGRVRGRRHTMLTDSDVHATRHARAAVGGVLAALTGEPAIYVSGGAENQGPPGGGPVTIVWELGPPIADGVSAPRPA